jgi:hypothetical protein
MAVTGKKRITVNADLNLRDIVVGKSVRRVVQNYQKKEH